MNSEQRKKLRRDGYNEFIGHVVQEDGRCKCGATEWPHQVQLKSRPCFVVGGSHNFAADNICQDCGNTRPSRN